MTASRMILQNYVQKIDGDYIAFVDVDDYIYPEYLENENTDPAALAGVLEKCYMQAIKNTSRIYDKKKDKEYLDELFCFIKKNGKVIYNDRENTMVRRLLGLLVATVLNQCAFL